MSIAGTTTAPTVREVPLAEWDGYLDDLGLDDTYLQRRYVESAALLDGGDPALVTCESAGGAVVCALLIRPIPGELAAAVGLPDDEYFDATSPYGYGGAVYVGDVAPMTTFREGFGSWAALRGVIATFMRSHPRFDNLATPPSGAVSVELTPTIAWRIAQDRDFVASMHKKHRSNSRRAAREGIEVAITRGSRGFDEFRALYEKTMRRQNAAEYYFFPDSYWDALREMGNEVVIAAGRRGGELMAGAICFDAGEWFHYHLGATADEARRIGASNLVLVEVAKYAASAGAKRFHLGGGVGGADDSLRNFKLRFDPGGEVPFGVIKCIHNAELYERLAGTSSPDGFFPAWRAPGFALER